MTLAVLFFSGLSKTNPPNGGYLLIRHQSQYRSARLVSGLLSVVRSPGVRPQTTAKHRVNPCWHCRCQVRLWQVCQVPRPEKSVPEHGGNYPFWGRGVSTVVHCEPTRPGEWWTDRKDRESTRLNPSTVATSHAALWFT